MYVRIVGRVRVNVASLNAQGTVGNVVELTKARMLRRSDNKFELVEVPVVTGNALKHWHFAHFVVAYKQLGGEALCEYCNRFIGYRSPDATKADEESFVKSCAGEDLHGFMQPEKRVRRDSLVKVSFMIPAEDGEIESGIDTLTHNRVVVNEKGVVETREEAGRGREAAMMLFKRQYSSAFYGLQMNLDLYYVGRLLFKGSNDLVIEGKERDKRCKAALLALLPLLSGQLGASRARAEPAWSVEELVVAWSNGPLPTLTHGCYSNYFLDSVRTLATFAKLFGKNVNVYVYGIRETLLQKAEEVGVGRQLKEQQEKGACGNSVNLVKVSSWQEIVERLVEDYESCCRTG